MKADNRVRQLRFRLGGGVPFQWGMGGLLAVCFCCVVAFLAISIASVAYPFDLDIYEGCIFLPASRMAEGLPVYGRAVAVNPPFVFTNYGPVYYALVAAAIRAVGLAFWPGRLLSLVSVLATALMIGYVVRREREGYPAATVAAALYLMMPATWTFGSLQRVDALGVCFSVLPWGRPSSARAAAADSGRFLLAGAAASLAVLTKQSLIAAGLAIFLTLLVGGRGRAIVGFLTGCAAVAGAFGGWAWLTANTDYFFNQAANAASALHPEAVGHTG